MGARQATWILAAACLGAATTVLSADTRAMYRAKEAGPGAVVWADPSSEDPRCVGVGDGGPG